MVRTRFAPSPTGFLHVGGLRTALYNYLFTRKNKGTFILRIEDTDQTRYVEGALESLLKTLKQVDLEYDEGPEKNGSFGPYIQSERTEIYRKYAQQLLEKKAAYMCFCTSQRLEEMRERQTRAKQAPMYDRTCLNLTPEEIEAKKQQGSPYVIRQKIPHGNFLKFNDLIRGRISFETSTIDDQVLIKSDNFPTYHLANVIDDHLMEITHVIRGEEWLPSAPKHILLYQAFGWEPPQFAHIPLLLNKDKTKLSKRQGDVSVESYLNKGYGKEALLNFIALLGWHPGKGIEQEIFSIDELIEAFSLEKVHKAGAIFEIEKLDWFNFQWNKRKHAEELKKMALETQAETKKREELANVENDLNSSKAYIEERGEEFYLFPSLESFTKYQAQRGKLLEKMLPKEFATEHSEWLKENEKFSKALITLEEKILKNPHETASHLKFYFEMQDYSAEMILNSKMKIETYAEALDILQKIHQALESFNDFDSMYSIKRFLLKFIATFELKNGQLLWPLRVILTGEQFSPGAYEVMWALGKQQTMKRIENALLKLKMK